MSGGGLGEAADDAYARRLEAVVAGHRGEAAVAERLLSDSAAAVRAAALGALARCGELQVAQVRRALGDEAAAVRCRAAELAPVEVELVRLLSDPDASVVEAAAAALGERDRDPGPVEELCQVARGHDDPLCRESAVAALGAIAAGLDADADADAGPDAAQAMALEVLLAAMEDRPQIRRRALLGLHQFDDDRAADAVRAALEDRDRQVRAVAGELLGVPVH
ncbi:HEAT repeat domain-containing protein [Candidatus Poriferisodalis sp.]|uniref:HEAT repeat domain-containing protein n=1 Tax=Candidatus Poriferisodalis sp. TaxID=3101277 RepID=UPI003C6F4CFC